MSAFSFRLIRDNISPKLSRMAAAAKRPEPIFRAMGTTFLSLVMGNFKSADYRPAPWPAKKDGSPATLQKSGTLSRSFHLTVTNTHATVANPMVYAAIHQFGSEGYVSGKQDKVVQVKHLQGGLDMTIVSTNSGIPPRPFFPVVSGKLTPAAEEKIQAAGQRAASKQFGS